MKTTKWMSHGLLLVAMVLALVGCGKSTGRTLTSATGSVYECLVVMNDAPLTQAQLTEVAKTLTLIIIIS